MLDDAAIDYALRRRRFSPSMLIIDAYDAFMLSII